MSTPADNEGEALPAPTATGMRRWLPDWLAPRSEERHGRGELRLIESFVLIVIALVLAVATVNDLVREVNNGKRLSADLKGWEHYVREVYPHAYYHNPLIEQDVKTFTTRDVVCANTDNVKPAGTVLICLIFTGPVHNGIRSAHGGYYLKAEGKDVHQPVLNDTIYSFGCFGTAIAEKLCLATAPPGKSYPPLPGVA